MNVYVRILKSNTSFDIDYTYIVPMVLRPEINVGVFVDVPFGLGNRKLLAVVTELNVPAPFGFEEKVKEIISVNPGYDPLNKKQIELAQRISQKYVCSFSEAISLMTVEKLKKKEKVTNVCLLLSQNEAHEIVSGTTLKNINEINVINFLLSKEDFTCEKSEILSSCNVKPTLVASLKKKRIVEEVSYSVTSYDKVTVTGREDDLETPKKLNDQQQEAFDKLKALYEEHHFSEFLLRGVTGSGKTEVYLNLLSHILEEGSGAILLVPEIALTAQMIERVRKRFGNELAVIHSRLTDRERQVELAKIRQGLCRIVVGVRSAVFAPVKNIKLIIVDEEQEPSYKSFEMKPFYHAAEVAAMRMKQENGLVVYGSATPRVSTYYRAKSGEIGYYFLSQRALSQKMPEVKIVDMRKETQNGNSSPISSILAGELHKNLEKGEQSILFVPRRGYSAKLTCLKCGKTLGCRFCHVPVSYHHQANRVICHYCGYTGLTPTICPSCGEPALSSKTFGTEKIEEELNKMFPGVGVVRMDTDTTRERGGHKKLLDEFGEDKVPFLIGTQMIAKGLDFPNVTLVGVINADSLLSISEYDAVERAFVLLTQVFGRAGRAADKPGRCILQTRNPSEDIFKQAANQNYDEFYEKEINYRKNACFPPFVSMSTITITGLNDREVYDTLVNLRDKLLKENGDLEILKVTRCQIQKINDNYRWSFVVKSIDSEKLIFSMNRFYKENITEISKKKMKLIID